MSGALQRFCGILQPIFAGFRSCNVTRKASVSSFSAVVKGIQRSAFNSSLGQYATSRFYRFDAMRTNLAILSQNINRFLDDRTISVTHAHSIRNLGFSGQIVSM